MKRIRSLAKVAFVAGALCLVAVPSAVAQEKAAAAAPEDPMQQMMQAYAEYGAVGPQHEKLAERAGAWDAVITMWPMPGAEPQVSKSTSVIKVVMGGRYLIETFQGEVPGMGPFEGMGITGYDNLKKQYVSIWFDSMSSGVARAYGDAKDDGKTLEWISESPDFEAGTYKEFRIIETEIDAKTRRMDAYDTAPDGTEFLSMRIDYKKR